jgi:predicted DNA-binding transcriptional regulator AlpA
MTIANQATRKLTDPAMLEELRRAHEEFPLISIKETSKKYNVSIRSLRRWQAQGKMPERVKHGRRLKYRKAEVELCISRNRRPDRSQGL